jgi:hypothetical protein
MSSGTDQDVLIVLSFGLFLVLNRLRRRNDIKYCAY